MNTLKIFIISSFSFFIFSCETQRINHCVVNDSPKTIPVKMWLDTNQFFYLWKADKFGCNGFRRSVSFPILDSLLLGKEIDYIEKNLGLHESINTTMYIDYIVLQYYVYSELCKIEKKISIEEVEQRSALLISIYINKKDRKFVKVTGYDVQG